MRTLISSIVTMVFMGAAHGGDVTEIPVQPDDFTIRCALVNPDTGQPITAIIPGELVRATATVKAGSAVMASSVIVVATASAALYGFNMKINIGESTLTIPSVEERDEIADLYSRRDEPAPSEYGGRFVTDFTLPNEWPRSRVKLRVVARIPDIGSRACSKTLDVI